MRARSISAVAPANVWRRADPGEWMAFVTKTRGSRLHIVLSSSQFVLLLHLIALELSFPRLPQERFELLLISVRDTATGTNHREGPGVVPPRRVSRHPLRKRWFCHERWLRLRSERSGSLACLESWSHQWMRNGWYNQVRARIQHMGSLTLWRQLVLDG